MSSRRLRLSGFFVGAGKHLAGWRYPSAQAAGPLRIEYFQDLVTTAERACFDVFFLGDILSCSLRHSGEGLARQGHSVFLEPLTLLPALAMVTKHIGLIATASTSYNEPYHLARKLASLDYISHGRAGWNLVTSTSDAEARNFGLPAHLDHGVRYERAGECFDVVAELWDSWAEDAFLYDKVSGLYFDPQKLHVPDHAGRHFNVRGPLNVGRPPQGYPVIFQAGGSEEGVNLAARTADVVFAGHAYLDKALAFAQEVRSRAVGFGRDAQDVKVFPGLLPVVGRTQSEAEDKYAALQNLIHPAIGMPELIGSLGGKSLDGRDLTEFPLDGPVPDLAPTNTVRSRQQMLLDLARRENLTIRGLMQRVAGGDYPLIGTPGAIADHMEEWFAAGAADGFNVSFPYLPEGLTEFCDFVIPELRRRGLFRTQYEGVTLRENLGLPARARQFSRPARRTAL